MEKMKMIKRWTKKKEGFGGKREWACRPSSLTQMDKSASDAVVLAPGQKPTNQPSFAKK